MREVYRKFGRTVRFENGTTVRVEEAGEAVEDGETFTCRPIARRNLPDINLECGSLPPPSLIERVVITEGVAEHELADRKWSERTRRIHLSLVHENQRAIIDQADFDTTEITTIAAALQRCGKEREAPPRIRLAPNVTAALLPTLAKVAPPNIRIVQTAHGVDGKGEPLADGGSGWYRPSYRIRPIRMPFHLRIECDVQQIDGDLPRAIALLAPVDGLVVRLLCVDGNDVFPATVRVTRIDAAGPPVRWYPYGAGSFGSEMML